MVIMENVEDTTNRDDDIITQSINISNHKQEIEASNYPIIYHTTISQVMIDFPYVCDEKQTEIKVMEAPLVPVLIFHDTLVSLDIKIQFGSFGYQKKDQNEETKPTCRASSNNLEIVLDDLQGFISVDKVVKDMDDMISMFSVEASSEFIDSKV